MNATVKVINYFAIFATSYLTDGHGKMMICGRWRTAGNTTGNRTGDGSGWRWPRATAIWESFVTR